jgi:hypothetical protein
VKAALVNVSHHDIYLKGVMGLPKAALWIPTAKMQAMADGKRMAVE